MYLALAGACEYSIAEMGESGKKIIDRINKGIEALNIVVSVISKIEGRTLPTKGLSIKE